jgi:hypothetical protein
MTRLRISAKNLEALSVIELLRLHSAVLDELKARGAMRTRNNPVADYAEALVCKALSLQRAGKESKGHDATGPDGKRYEIKSRRMSLQKKSMVTSPLRGLDGAHFDEVIIVLFNEDYTVNRAVQLPRQYVRVLGSFRPHVNGWVIPLRESLWNDPHAKDITAQLRRCQGQSGKEE